MIRQPGCYPAVLINDLVPGRPRAGTAEMNCTPIAAPTPYSAAVHPAAAPPPSVPTPDSTAQGLVHITSICPNDNANQLGLRNIESFGCHRKLGHIKCFQIFYGLE